MKTYDNDFIAPAPSEHGNYSHGLTKLEHFALAIFQAKLIAKQADQGAIPSGYVTMLAKHSIHEATVFIKELNTHYERVEAPPRSYKMDVDIQDILGLDLDTNTEREETPTEKEKE